MSQRQEILRYMAQGHQITPMVAYKRFGCLSLSQRIGEIKREGWPVASKLVHMGNRRWASYWLPKARRA